MEKIELSIDLPEEILCSEQTNDRPKRLWGNYFVRRGEICGAPDWRAIESPFHYHLKWNSTSVQKKYPKHVSIVFEHATLPTSPHIREE